MTRPVQIPQAKIQEYFVEIDNFRGGSNTLLNERRIDKKFAYEINNMWQVQDGIWKTRPGTKTYGQTIAGATNLDNAIEFEKSDGTREIIVLADDGYAYKSTDGGTWTQLSGATFTTGNNYYFAQIGSKLYISNRVDYLTVYDGTSLTQYSALDNPLAPTPSRTGLTTGSYNNYYRIQAVNTVGHTTPSDSGSIATNKLRRDWDTSNYISLSWTAVTSATGYEIYWGERDGFEYLIGTSTTNSFIDYGETISPHNPYVETADDNTTAAPLFGPMEVSGNRLWATYDVNNKWRVYATGTGSYFVNPAFSPFYGGVWIDLEKGGKNKPVALAHYRTGKGDPIITVLCTSADGRGAIFQIELTSITIGDETATVPAAYKIIGSTGADSPDGVVKVGDNIFFANKKSIYALRNKEQIFNVLANDDMAAPIRNRYLSLNQSGLSNIAGYFQPPRVFYCLPEGGTSNDVMAIYDMERNNWTWKWTIGFKQIFEYTDSNDTTHLLAVPTSGNQLIELSENFQGDQGEAFYQSYISPLLPVHKKYRYLAKVNEAIFELGNFRGEVTCEVIGLTEDGTTSSVASDTATSTVGTSGIGDDAFSDMFFSDTGDAPTTFTQSTRKIRVEVGERLYALQFKVSSNNADSNYEILGLQAEGYILPTKSSDQWN